MIILVDTREQLPYWTAPDCAKATLLVGDYTTAHLFHKIHVERKSPQDWYNTIVRNHARFRREVLRAQDNGIELVLVIESSRKDFINKKFPQGERRDIKPETLDRICSTVSRRYQLKMIWCSGGRVQARKRVYKLLKQWEKNIKR
jgi:ERCC4-type nuclease